MQQPDGASLSHLRQLWGEFLPSLTPEQAQLSVQVWQKIQAQKQRQTQMDYSPQVFTEPNK